ncbi:Hypothetical predicted protein, partial [Marmota monax]
MLTFTLTLYPKPYFYRTFGPNPILTLLSKPTDYLPNPTDYRFLTGCSLRQSIIQ